MARADTVAINVPSIGTYPPLAPNGFNYTQANFQLGFNFSVAQPITITQLGYYNSALGGVAEPSGAFNTHTITLQDASQPTPRSPRRQ